jgi:predicted acylesterase/phospholipase RssA
LVDGGVVDSVPLWHALSGPVDRVFVFNVSAGAADREERSALDVVMTSFMHSRSQRFELEMRNVPPRVQVIVLPRPPDPRELFDFSGGRELIDQAHRLASAELDLVLQRPANEHRVRRRFWRPGSPEPVAG